MLGTSLTENMTTGRLNSMDLHSVLNSNGFRGTVEIRDQFLKQLAMDIRGLAFSCEGSGPFISFHSQVQQLQILLFPFKR